MVAASPQREHVIRTAWRERGAAQWDREVHGKGLEPLNIQASTNMLTQKPGDPLIPRYDNLEFRLERTTVDGEPMTAIVCEGIAVEMW